MIEPSGTNDAAPLACGATRGWRGGNVFVDRDRRNAGRGYGLAIGGGRIAFGVSGPGTGDYTLCGNAIVNDGAWHHVAVERRVGDGHLWIFVDGVLDAQATGPAGDISYPDNAAAVPCDEICLYREPFLVLGGAKFDVGGVVSRSFTGSIDELRISTKLRYAANFPRPRAPFVADFFTAALYHFDEGWGTGLRDVATWFGGRADGTLVRGGFGNGPQWVPDTPFNMPALANNAMIALVPVVNGLASPVEIVNAHDGSGRLYVVQQGGTIRIVRNGSLVATPFLDIASKISSGGERGLLGLAFHPDYRNNGRYFVYYTRASDGAIVIERYQRAAGNVERTDPNPATQHVLIVIPHPGQSNHNGGKLAFGPDGYLYAGTGDGGSGNDPPNNSQTLGVRLGKMLRFDVDRDTPPYYSIPPSNPWATYTCSGTGSGICPEIWAYGLRNPWRFSFDRVTGDQFIGDVGQGAREEVDWQPAGTPGGRNYGWRIIEGTLCTGLGPGACPMMDPNGQYFGPILEYAHDSVGGISITGGYRYRGDKVPPLAATYLYGDYGSQRIWAATLDSATGAWSTRQIATAVSALSAFGEDEDGELYVTGYGNGTLYRIAPYDADADGMPDWWELAYFGSTTAALSGADADGDGATNLAEYQNGTDPLSPRRRHAARRAHRQRPPLRPRHVA